MHEDSAVTEIEISYLPKELPAGLLDAIKPVRIVEIYLSNPSVLTTKIRLRQRGSTYELTKKVNLDPANLSVQKEYTIPLTKEEFELFRSAGGRELVKDRYKLPVQDHIAEFDVLRGDLDGFVMIEVEFTSEADRDAFVAPDYFGADITQEDFIAGAYLAGKTYTDIQSHLDRLGYVPINI